MRRLVLSTCLACAGIIGTTPVWPQTERRAIGIMIYNGAQGIELDGVVPGGPAQKAGLRAGDILEQVDGQSVGAMSSTDVISLITGAANTSVQLAVLDDGGRRRTVTVPRSLPMPADAEAEPASADDASSAELAGWKTYRSPSSLTIKHPADWLVDHSVGPGWLTLEVPGQQIRIVIGPVVLETAIDQTIAPVILDRLATQIADRAERQRGAAEIIGSTALRLATRGDTTEGVVAFSWTTTPNGTAGLLIAVTDGLGRLRQDAALVSRILGTLQFAGSAGSDLRFRNWSEPSTHAFSTDVPEGWRVEGSLEPASPEGYQPEILAVSPDNSITVFYGDIRHRFAEGTVEEAQSRVEHRYGSGVAAAQAFGTAMLGAQCHVTGLQASSDFTHANWDSNWRLTKDLWQQGFDVKVSVGDAHFGCGSSDGKALAGYFVADALKATNLATGQDFEFLTDLNGYVAEIRDEATARAVLARMVGKFQYDQEWRARQHPGSDLARALADGIMYSRETVIDGQVDQDLVWKAAIYPYLIGGRSEIEAVDPRGGRHFTVEMNGAYNWIGADGRIVGTNARLWPAYDLAKLMARP